MYLCKMTTIITKNYYILGLLFLNSNSFTYNKDLLPSVTSSLPSLPRQWGCFQCLNSGYHHYLNQSLG